MASENVCIKTHYLPVWGKTRKRKVYTHKMKNKIKVKINERYRQERGSVRSVSSLMVHIIRVIARSISDHHPPGVIPRFR